MEFLGEALAYMLFVIIWLRCTRYPPETPRGLTFENMMVVDFTFFHDFNRVILNSRCLCRVVLKNAGVSVRAVQARLSLCLAHMYDTDE
jgi:hypothetical protein